MTLRALPEDARQGREWTKVALAPALSSDWAGRQCPSATVAFQTSSSQLPVLQLPCCILSLQRLYPMKQCDHEPWKMGPGPINWLVAIGWPHVIRGEAETSICSFSGRPPTSMELRAVGSFLHPWTDCVPSSSPSNHPLKLPESVGFSGKWGWGYLGSGCSATLVA